MNKISLKLATYFILPVLVMEAMLMFYLHQNIEHSRIDEEFSQLISRGSNHRDVLETQYSESALHHITLMESSSINEIVIIDKDFNVIESSINDNQEINSFIKKLYNENFKVDQIIESNWKEEDFIVSIHPFNIDNGEMGYVLMFQSTLLIQQLVEKLNFHFILAGISSLIALCIVYFTLSKILTRPLIRMKEATEKLSKGDFNVKLPNQDNDELGELSTAIQKLSSDLERIQINRIEFLSSISHELRTPLTYLSGYTKVALRKNLTEEDRERYLTIISEESNRMISLVENLFDLAKMDGTSFTVSKEVFNSVPYFNKIYQLMVPSFNLKNIQLQLNCKKFDVIADPLRLEQIMINLLDNSLKYSNEFTITTVEAFEENGKTVIIVSDQGIGIPVEDSKFIFEKFYRVEKSRSRQYGGTGLGLAVVKDLVKAHGGQIEVKSVIGKGTIFTVRV